MERWRDAVLADGFVAPETYVATGNMIVEGRGPAGDVEARMDEIVMALGLSPSNKAIVRTPASLQALLLADPFPAMTSERPAEVGVHFFAEPNPRLDWVDAYAGPERIHVAGQHLIINYGGRGAMSGLPAVVERKSGLATARNWNTVRALANRSAARTG